jgi:glycine/D-amino acid oxidase-like deaminating enzyme
VNETFAQWPDSLWRNGQLDWNFDCLPRELSCDVAIVGAGFTGLWTAHHLLEIDPHLSIAIIEARQPGFGASGRNGGWCSALYPTSLATIAKETSREAAINLQGHLIRTVENIGAHITKHDIQCGWSHSGTLSYSRNEAQLARQNADLIMYRDLGLGDEFMHSLSSSESQQRIKITKSLGASFTPHCASLNPAQLLDGLVTQLLEKGVTIFGDSIVSEIENRSLRGLTVHGPAIVNCKWSVRATEGFTARLPKHRRTIAPLYSYMIATEPIPSFIWNDIGWDGRETWNDGRNMIVYAQRTSDDRIAFGGRGAPYKFASRIGGQFDRKASVHQLLEATLHELLPTTKSVEITNRWGGSLGVHRDWHPSVKADRTTGQASAGGYVGDGVAFSCLAAEALSHEILDTDNEIRTLPFMQHVSPKWEPEPLRWLGINGMISLTQRADEAEENNKPVGFLTRQLLQRFVP